VLEFIADTNISSLAELSTEGFNFYRERLRHLMPGYMKEFEKELGIRLRPNQRGFRKAEFIKHWLTFFDECFSKENVDHYVETIERFNVLHLIKSFEWVADKFAELDLGGNMKWCRACLDVLELLKSGRWDNEGERLVLSKYLVDTRWYEL
jgi:hypothetical protein